MRKTTVLALDVVNFSKHMAENPENTVEVLSSRRKIIHELIKTNDGSVFNEAGDSIVAEFSSGEMAATCALLIQQEMARINIGSEPERRMLFRAGINFGDVIDSDGNVFGDTVNVAARLEAASSPEGVYISKSAYDNLAPITQDNFQFLGALSLKNIPRKIEVFVWVPSHQTGRYGFSNMDKVSEVEIVPGSLAVLELKNISSDEEQQYFCEGVSEELINTLSRYRSLRVTSSNASFSFSDGKHSPQEIGNALSVKYVLSGSVRSSSSRIRIGIKLDNAETNRTIWSEKFEAAKEDLWDLEESLAAKVAYQIVGQVEADEIRSSANKPPENARAYDLVLQGLKYHREAEVSYDDAKKAYDLFSRAVELEPNYPRALAWSVCSMSNLQAWDPSAFPEDWLDGAIKNIKRALEIDPDDAEANRIMGSMQRSKGNFDLSIIHHRHASELCPSDLYISYKLCQVLMYDARIDEAEIELARAKEINPTGSDLIFEIEGTLQFWCNQFESSQLVLNKIRIPNPVCSIFMAANDFYLGRKEEARRLIIQIENDFALPVQRVFAGESYRTEEMKAKIAPLFPLREVA